MKYSEKLAGERGGVYLREHHKNTKYRKALKAAFPYTIPIFAGFWFLGLTYGIYMNVSGFSFWYPCLMSLTIFAGSVEFVAVNMLLGAFDPLQAFAMTLMINARHLFYGISMLDRYKGTGLKKFYLIFGMCDESFSINYTANIMKDFPDIVRTILQISKFFSVYADSK